MKSILVEKGLAAVTGTSLFAMSKSSLRDGYREYPVRRCERGGHNEDGPAEHPPSWKQTSRALACRTSCRDSAPSSERSVRMVQRMNRAVSR